MAADLPLSVWATAQQTARTQRAGRYVEISGHHPAKMLPVIAQRAIATYTRPGDLVADPMCGIGSTLVEAVHLGRDAIGVEYEPKWADLARANVAYARAQGATGHGEVVCGDARHVTGVVDPAVRGLVALVLTSPPYGPSLHGRVTARPGQGIAKAHDRYSTDPTSRTSG
jgi:modification methylase